MPSKHANSNNFDGRPYGGSAIFWRIHHSIIIEVCSSDEHFVIANVSYYDYSFCMANIYMPCDKRTADSLCAYQRVLGELQAAIDMLDVNNIVCIGDFNADPNRGRVWPYLYDFIEHNHFNVPDLLLPIDTFTYLSPAHNTTSWLDHVVSSDAVNVCNVCVHYDIALFDHFPISFNIAIDKAENLNALDDHIAT